LDIVRGNLRRLGLEAKLIVADATAWNVPTEFDAVLVDAPCSGTGVIRRHPDIARLKTPEDVARSVALQRRILDAAADMVTPGGVLVYAVCSLQTEEGERQIDAFLGRDARFARHAVAAAGIAGQAELLTAGGDIRTLPCHWPDRGGLDGFYIARLRRAAA
jgi:16S rRNA (cytosine967-C5)-methyltransferase